MRIPRHERCDGDAKAEIRTEPHKVIRSAAAPFAEAEIRAHNHMPQTKAPMQNVAREGLGAQRGQRLVEGQFVKS